MKTMKTNHTGVTAALGCAALLLLGQQTTTALEANATNTTATTAPPEDLGYDFHEGKTNKIARVYAVTPADVQVIYEGGKGGRRIPRYELSPELETRYPYDAQQAAEYRRQLADVAAQQAAARGEAVREYYRRQEACLSAELARLGKEDAGLEGQIRLYRRMAPGNGRKVQLAHLLNQRQQIREQTLKLQDQLASLRSRRLALP